MVCSPSHSAHFHQPLTTDKVPTVDFTSGAKTKPSSISSQTNILIKNLRPYNGASLTTRLKTMLHLRINCTQPIPDCADPTKVMQLFCTKAATLNMLIL